MWNLLLFVLSISSFLATGLGDDDIVGKGQWVVLSILECENLEQYDWQVNVSRRKMNRTHDGFSLQIDLDRELNYTYGVELIADKKVDGGFKFYHQMRDDSLCQLAEKYTGTNWNEILALAKVDPPTCPIPAGKIRVDNFVIKYRQLEENGMYGTFDVHMYILYMGRKLACTRWLVRFEKVRERDDDDDDYDDDY